MNTKFTQQIIRIILWVSVLFPLFTEAQIRYVDASRPSSGAGTNWGNAYKTLAEALNVANSNTTITEIRIAEGTYYPTTGTSRNETFLITRGNLRLYGGYPSGGGSRNLEAHPTILSGDIGSANDLSDNSYHVMVIINVTSGGSIQLDGLHFYWGNANGGNNNQSYNGQNVLRNVGGGLVLMNNMVDITVSNCRLSANFAGDAGAGLFVRSNSPKIVNCLFTGNTANYGGGSMNADASHAEYINCTFAGNRSRSGGNSGGAIRNSSSNPLIRNSIIWGNSSGISEGSPVLNNSLVQGFTNTGNGNLNGNTTDPLFESNPAIPGAGSSAPLLDGNCSLQQNSPCLNTGREDFLPSGIITDIAGNRRLWCVVDMGAYERSMIRYVKAGGTGNGSSWANASGNLQQMIDLACAGTEIWVAAGTYISPGNGFTLKNDITVYGGFPNTGTPGISQRNYNIHISILSGNNVRRVIYNDFEAVSALTNSAVLDGFTLSGGHISNGSGGAVYNLNASPALHNLIFTNNHAGNNGGAVFNTGSSNPLISYCRFISNNAAGNGGAVYNAASSPSIRFCHFSGNTANSNGGAVCNASSSVPQIVNSLFSGNTAAKGGAIYANNSSSYQLINSTISGNSAPAGGGVAHDNGTTVPQIRNTIVYGNSGTQIWNGTSSSATVSNSLVQGGYTGTNNIDANPEFIHALAHTNAPFITGDYRLMVCSPAINSGNNGAISGFTTDLNGDSRIYGGTVDIGAFETQASPLAGSILYVDASRPASGNGNSWATAYKSLSDALVAANNCSGSSVEKIHIARGVYYPEYAADGISTNPRDKAFVITKSNLIIEGGYPNGGGTRDVSSNPTILSGDFNNNDILSFSNNSLAITNNSDNAYHVIITSGVSGVVLDGVMIQGGNANGTGNLIVNNNPVHRNSAGALFNTAGNISIRYVVFEKNRASRGGAVRSYGQTSHITIEYSELQSNSADLGGAIFMDGSSLTVNSSFIRGNYSVSEGGAFYNYNNANARFVNTVFSGNSSGGTGSVVYNSSGSTALYNVTASGNFGNRALDILSGSSMEVSNSVFWGNSGNINNAGNLSVNYSITQSTHAGNNNLVADPLFYEAPAYSQAPFITGDYKLQICSPAINTGSNSLIPAGVNNDISEGKARIRGSVVDRGAYELQADNLGNSNVLYVDGHVAVSGNGTTWITAFKYLSEALKVAHSCSGIDTIKVARGTYYPMYSADGNSADARNKSFTITRGGLTILGGYPAGGGVRNAAANLTVLSGDIDRNGIVDDGNAYHVVITSGNSINNLFLDGFTIREGNANNSNSHIVVNGYTIYHHDGGGWYNAGANAVISNVTFTANIANWGAGWYNQNGNPRLTSTHFRYNTALSGGGAWFNIGGQPTIINSLIADNHSQTGAGWYNNGGNPGIINTTISNNNGGEWHTGSGDPSIRNSIIWGNGISGGVLNNRQFSLCQGYNDESYGNIPGTAFPYFINSSAGNYRLLPCSQGINAGDNIAVPSGLTTDLAGNPRFFGSSVDIGAYETQEIVNNLYVDSSRTVSGDGRSWATAFRYLSEAIQSAHDCPGVENIYIAKGTYFPTGVQTGTNRDTTFLISRGNLNIYGGYAPGGTSRSNTIYPVILSGDIGTAGNNSDNSYHVMVIAGIQEEWAGDINIDGVSFVWGNAGAGGTYIYNGQSVQKNDGGGLVLWNNENGIYITNCVISANRVADAGGGVMVSGTSPVFINCLFSGNAADYGGGACNAGGSATEYVNCTFSGNRDNNNGGGMRNSSSNPKIYNTIIYGNNGGISNNNSSPDIQYSLVQGQTNTSNGNINGNTNNPSFEVQLASNLAPVTGGDYRLRNSSPCINKGSAEIFSPLLPVDLEGNNRIISNEVDMGAYEYARCPGVDALFVDSSKSVSGDGSTWATAFKTLSEATALLNCPEVRTIYVAQGTYYPTGNQDGSNRDLSFVIPRGEVKIYGGYAPGGMYREPSLFPTILSGDIGVPGNNSDNSYHVVVITGVQGLDEEVILDGLSIHGGNAGGSGSYQYNGQSIQRNDGGGMVIWNNNSYNINISNCIIAANRASDAGGGVMVSGSVPYFYGCLFSGNTGDYGGGAFNASGADGRYVNCTFAGNRDNNNGGGMRNSSSNPSIENTIIYGNTGGISNNNSSPSISHSLVQGYTSGGLGNLNGNLTNPLFTEPLLPASAPTTAGDYRLMSGSPCIDKGSTMLSGAHTAKDLAGNDRVISGEVDMGAYEFAGCPGFGTLYVDSSIAFSGNGSSWTTAFKTLAEAFERIQCSEVKTIHIAKGTYYPTGQQSGTDRDVSFVISRGDIEIIGGYAPGGAVRSLVDYPTILSGDIGLSGNSSDNSYHVMVIAGVSYLDEKIILDGLNIYWGNAGGSGSYQYNGQSIQRNDGGGLVFWNNDNRIVVRNCIISANRASDAGGGVMVSGNSGLSFYSCLFSGNTGDYGGGACNADGATTEYGNCTFAGNRDNNNGGGMRNSSANPFIYNSIIYGNSGGISNNNASVNVSFSLIQGNPSTADGNLNGNISNPLFNAAVPHASAPSVAGDYSLQMSSVCINRGYEFGTDELPETDLAGNPRVVYGQIDLGAYEYAGCPETAVLYVDSSVTTSGDGTSWNSAFKTLTEAFRNIRCSDLKSIHVAQGTYFPTGQQNGTNRDSAFVIPRGGIRIYGGYAPGGGERSPADYPTILSGDIGESGNNSDNSYHVVVIAGLQVFEDSIVLDGLNISWGNASGSGSYTYNGESIQKNDGGGIVIWNSVNRIAIRNSIISANRASDAGGGAIVSGGYPTFLNCLFSGNAGDYGGGALNASGSAAKYINCTFAGNRDNHGGGGMRNSSSRPVITNTVIYGNSDGISNNSSSPSISYSLIQGSTNALNNNISGNINPLYYGGISHSSAPVAGGDYRLQSNSMLVNAGDNAAYQTAGGDTARGTDLAGVPRVTKSNRGARIDIGAYENEETDFDMIDGGGVIRYVKEGASGNGTSWARASGDLQAMINISNPEDQIWVAKGTYWPNRKINDINTITPNHRDNTFLLKSGVKIYGGFEGKELVLEHRNLDNAANVSTLSGDFNGDDTITLGPYGDLTFNNNAENAYHVLVAVKHSDIVLDGFTIRGGRANNSGSVKIRENSVYRNEGALLIVRETQKLTIRNCKFYHGHASAQGGAISMYDSDETLIEYSEFVKNKSDRGGGISIRNINMNQTHTINNTTISHNDAVYDGGGIFFRIGNLRMSSTIVSGNKANNHAGGIYVYKHSTMKADLKMTSCLVTGNHAGNEGGGLRIATYYTKQTKDKLSEKEVVATLVNCTFSGNSASSGGAIYRHSGFSRLNVINGIIYGNSSGISGGKKNVYVRNSSMDFNTFHGIDSNNMYNPEFYNAPSHTGAPFSGGDYRLLACSRLIDGGIDETVDLGTINLGTTDLAENPRVYQKIDIGAYEYQGDNDNGTIFYVKQGGTGDGSSWNNAFGDLQAAINAANCGDTLFVAKGLYKPNRRADNVEQITLNNRNNAFVLKSGIFVFGGFAGNEAAFSQRNVSNPANASILSGDFNGDDDVTTASGGTINYLNNGENAYHVVLAANEYHVHLDGFTIKGGRANNSGQINVNGRTVHHNNGAALLAIGTETVEISNCLIENSHASNLGGGIHFWDCSKAILKNLIVRNNKADYGGGFASRIRDESHNVIIDNCNFSANNAVEQGGGLYLRKGDYLIQQTIVSGNRAFNSHGGGIYAFRPGREGGVALEMRSCLITGNRAGDEGGGLRIAHYRGSVELTSSLGGDFDDRSYARAFLHNCTFSGNRASGSGGAIQKYGSIADLTLFNCIIWDNNSGITGSMTANYSTIQNRNESGAFNNTLDPLFYDSPDFSTAPFTGGDYRLRPCSYAINTGGDTTVHETDIAGNPRVRDVIDRGAYEYQNDGISEVDTIYVKQGSTGNGSSWSNSMGDLQEAINAAKCGDKIFVAKGTYKPNRRANAPEVITPGNRDNAFVLKNKVEIYGGFAGHESSPSERNLSNQANASILSGDFNDNDDVTVSENGTVNYSGNGENAYHVVIASNAEAVLDGVSITGGRANGSNSITVNNKSIPRNSGAGVACTGAIVTLKNTQVMNSHASNRGGGINTEDSDLHIDSSAFSRNKADYGGAVALESGNSLMTDCRVEMNNAVEDGGGIYTSKTKLTTQSVKIHSNRARQGGAVYNRANSTAKILLCNISGNEATAGGGGGLYNTSDSDLQVVGCLITGNKSSNAGAGIRNNNSALIVNTTISGNHASSGTGGVHREQSINEQTIQNSIIYGNSSGLGGGTSNIIQSVIQGGTPTTTVYTDNPGFRNALNSSLAPVTGGDYRADACWPVVNNGDTSGIGHLLPDRDISGSLRYSGGRIELGAYEIEDENLSKIIYVKQNGTGDGSSWVNASGDLQEAINRAVCTGDTIFVGQGTYKPNRRADNLFEITPAHRDNAFVLRSGVKIYGGFAGTETSLEERYGYPSILSGDFNGDDSRTGAGYNLVISGNSENAIHVVVAVNESDVVLDGFTIEGGNASGSSELNVQGYSLPRHSGAGIIIERSNNIRLSNLNIRYNRVADFGGAANFIDSEITASNCQFDYNRANDGGGIRARGAKILLNECFVRYNGVPADGGGLFISGSSTEMIMNDTWVKGNSARSDGGGMRISGSTVVMNGGGVDSNRAENGAGGGFFNLNNATLRMTDASLSDNYSKDNGGGIWSGSTEYDEKGAKNFFTRVTIAKNRAGGNGGGIYNRDGESILNHVWLKENKASNGGGIYNNKTSIRVYNSVIYKNSADHDAAGIYNTGRSRAYVINSTIVGNTAAYGGGIYNKSYKCPPIPNNNYYACYDDGSSSDIRNSIIWGNEAQRGAGIYEATSEYSSSVSNSLIQGLNNNENGNLNASAVEPRFTDIATGDVSLSPGSPCLNAGRNALLTGTGIELSSQDILGNNRISQSIIDMGAMEYQFMANAYPIRYVRENAEGSGTSWEDASGNLQAMINVPGVSQVWVGEGTYMSSGAGFRLKNQVAVYGGFPSSGNPAMTERDPDKYFSVLSGNDERRVIYNNFNVADTLFSSAVLDGFTITRGRSEEGGAVYNSFASPGLYNLTFTDNHALTKGGAMYNLSSDPVLKYNKYLSNTSDSVGGAIYNDRSAPFISHATFSGNSAEGEGGAIVNTNVSVPVIINSLFSGNTASDGGAIFANIGSAYKMTNSTVADNISNTGGALSHSDPATGAQITNSIIFGNMGGSQVFSNGSPVSVTYSIVNNYTGTGNISANPLFVNPAAGDYRVDMNSPAINSGNNDAFTDIGGDIENSSDLAGEFRVYDSIIDIGAYEFQGKSLFPVRYVREGANGNGISWSTASGDLQAMINTPGVEQIWVAEGTYYSLDSGFVMKNGVEIYGGFPATGTPAMEERDWVMYPSVLSGNHQRRVFYHNFSEEKPLYRTALLDGFTIASGKATGHGGAMYNKYAYPKLLNIVFEGNSALNGAAVYNENSSPIISHCSFRENIALENGGAIYNTSFSFPEILNSLLSDNSALNGAAIYASGMSSYRIVSSTIAGNTASLRGAVYHTGDSVSAEIFSSIVYGNNGGQIINENGAGVNVSYSLVQDWQSGLYNKDADPLFVNAAAGDYRLQMLSPAINTGSDSLYIVLLALLYDFEAIPETGDETEQYESFARGMDNEVDLIRMKRIYEYENGGSIDMGAFENQEAAVYSVRYVMEDGGGDGTSWSTASGDIQAMIDEPHVQQVWVAEGTYLPVRPADNLSVIESDNRFNAFVMKKDVKIYGGFPAEGSPGMSHRNWTTYPSFLSGNIGDEDDNSDNTYHVVIAAGDAGNAALEGFIVMGGNTPHQNSNTIMVNGVPVVTERGAGINISQSSPLISNVILSGNAGYAGGAIANTSSSPTLTNVLLYNNTGDYGAAIYNTQSSPELMNVTIANNQALTTNNQGVAMRNVANSSPKIYNSIIWGNKNADNSINNIFNAGGANPNSIPEYYHSLIETAGQFWNSIGSDRGGNIDANPMFADTSSGDYRLLPCSPAINTGISDTAEFYLQRTDLSGNPRTLQDRIDMGAYENQGYLLQTVANTALTASGSCETPDGWIHFYHHDDEDKIFVSVHPQGQDLGEISAATVLHENYGLYTQGLPMPYGQAKNFYPFNRSWALESENTFTNPVSIRFYFHETDSADVSSQMVVDSLSKLILYKVDGNDVWNIQATGYKEYQYSENADTSGYIFGKYQDIRYAEFQVTSFSTGTMAMTMDDAILPLDLLSFTASAVDDKTYLQWHTVNEENVSHFGIERSSDARNWETISTITALNGIEQHYDAWDGEPLSGINYYRLKMTDLDGTYKYSKIVEVTFGQESHTQHYRIYPNPNNGTFHVLAQGIVSEETQMFLFDGLGRLVHNQLLHDGNNLVNTRNIASGMYYLKIENKESSSSYKVVID